MCGIVGLWNVDAEQPGTIVQGMLNAMAHRGPDGRGALEYRGGAAGMVRLALVDPTPRGQQPLWSLERGVAILFNGEVYNFREERARLASRDVTFRTGTDTEVVLKLYLESGLDFVHRLRGMFAIAIFDWRETGSGNLPKLVLVRDPLGIKPLYVAHPQNDPQRVIFASEVRSLLSSKLIEREIDRGGLCDYLAHGFLVQPRTLIRGVRMLEPGTLECYTPGAPMTRRTFWQIPAFAPRNETLDEAAQRLRQTLDESVKLHSMADVPVGAFLSGGIDSTGIVGLMRQHISDLRTYTLRFPDLEGQDESKEAADAAARFGCHNTMVDVTGSEIPDLLPRFAAAVDVPSIDGFNSWLISQAAARDVKAVLSGLGGDEWFAGYPVTRRMARFSSTYLGRAQALAGILASALGGMVPAGPIKQRIENMATRKSNLATWIHAHTVFRYDVACGMAGLVPNDLTEEAKIAGLLNEKNARWYQETAVGLSCLLDSQIYMCHQLLRDSDATSMSHSLELRVPLVDLRVAAFSRTCADDYKLRPDGGSGSHYGASGAKQVLIHALKDVLPTSIINRPKRGFSLPMVKWLQGSLAPLLADTCDPQTVARRGLVDPRVVAALWEELRSGNTDVLFPQFWSLMVLELWCRAVLDPDVASLTSHAAVPA